MTCAVSAGAGVTEDGVHDGTLAQLDCLLIGHLRLVERVQNA